MYTFTIFILPLDVELIVNNDVVWLEITMFDGKYRTILFLAEHVIEKALLVDTVLIRNVEKLTLSNSNVPIFQKSLEIGLCRCRA